MLTSGGTSTEKVFYCVQIIYRQVPLHSIVQNSPWHRSMFHRDSNGLRWGSSIRNRPLFYEVLMCSIRHIVRWLFCTGCWITSGGRIWGEVNKGRDRYTSSVCYPFQFQMCIVQQSNLSLEPKSHTLLHARHLEYLNTRSKLLSLTRNALVGLHS